MRLEITWMHFSMNNKELTESSPVNIVIPMAGEGRRFAEAGFKQPKPFIDVNGRMMIERALDSFKKLKAGFVLVVPQSFLKERKAELGRLEHAYSLKIVSVPGPTLGAAVTALAARRAVDPGTDIIFADCDNFFAPSDIGNFVKEMRARALDGGLLTCYATEPCYSYARTDGQGRVLETREKEVISPHAICGVYYFGSPGIFQEAALDMIVANERIRGEFYLSNVYNYLKKITTRIGIFEVSSFTCVGTPGQLELYLKALKAAKS